jgi:hypothetical protein
VALLQHRAKLLLASLRISASLRSAHGLHFHNASAADARHARCTHQLLIMGDWLAECASRAQISGRQRARGSAALASFSQIVKLSQPETMTKSPAGFV